MISLISKGAKIGWVLRSRRESLLMAQLAPTQDPAATAPPKCARSPVTPKRLPQGSTLCWLRLLLNADLTLQCLKAWTLNRKKHEKTTQHVPSHNAEGPSLFCVHIMGSLALTCVNFCHWPEHSNQKLSGSQPHFNGTWAAAHRPVTSGRMRNHHPLEGGHLGQRVPQLATENG